MALEGLLCRLRSSQGGNSFNYQFLTASEALLREDCINFLVDNTEQVQKTPGFERLVEKNPTIIKDFLKLIVPRVKKPRIGGC